jgi:hypothetical protein
MLCFSLSLLCAFAAAGLAEEALHPPCKERGADYKYTTYLGMSLHTPVGPEVHWQPEWQHALCASPQVMPVAKHAAVQVESDGSSGISQRWVAVQCTTSYHH